MSKRGYYSGSDYDLDVVDQMEADLQMAEQGEAELDYIIQDRPEKTLTKASEDWSERVKRMNNSLNSSSVTPMLCLSKSVK